MTSHVGRLYALSLALLVFFLAWAAVAAKPWAAKTKADPRAAALVAREQALRHEAALVRRVVARRWALYRIELKRRNAAIAAAQRQQLAAVSAAPSASVRVVNLPPLTVTRTS